MKRKPVQAPQIVQSRSNLWLILLFILWLLLVIAAGGAYAYVHHYGIPIPYQECEAVAPDESQINALEEEVAQLQEERDTLRLKAAQFERASQIDKQVVSAVRLDLQTLQEERAELGHQVAFLKSLVSGDITALQLLDIKIAKTNEPLTYEYSMTVSKRAKGQTKVKGELALSIVGTQKGESTTLQTEDLTLEGNALIMDFQNYQNFQGTLKLPDQFSPEKLDIAVSPEGKTFKSFEKSFPWELLMKGLYQLN